MFHTQVSLQRHACWVRDITTVDFVSNATKYRYKPTVEDLYSRDFNIVGVRLPLDIVYCEVVLRILARRSQSVGMS